MDNHVRTTSGLLEASQLDPRLRTLTHLPPHVGVFTFDGDRRLLLRVPAYALPPAGKARYIVHTHTGRRIYLSEDQDLASTFEDAEGDLFLEPMSPQVGLLVARRVAPVPDEKLDLLEHFRLPEEPPMTRNRYVDEVHLDGDYGYFVGVISGDGWANAPGTSKQGAVMIANNDEDLLADIYRIVRSYKLGGELIFTVVDNPHEFDGHECESQKTTFTWYCLAQFIRDYIGCGAENKRLPVFMLSTSAACRWNILAGLIDTDGTVAVSQPKAKKENVRSTQVNLQYNTSSWGLAKDVVALADSLGLTATISKTTAPSGNPAYTVCFTQESVAHMQGRLPLRIRKKADTLASHTLGTARRRGKYAPPLDRGRLKEMRRELWSVTQAKQEGWSKAFEKRRMRLYGNISDALRKPDPKYGRRGCGALLLDTATAIIREIPEFFESGYWRQWKEMVEDTSIVWEIITAIEVLEGDEVKVAIPTAVDAFTVSGSGFLITSFHTDDWENLPRMAA